MAERGPKLTSAMRQPARITAVGDRQRLTAGNGVAWLMVSPAERWVCMKAVRDPARLLPIVPEPDGRYQPIRLKL